MIEWVTNRVESKEVSRSVGSLIRIVIDPAKGLCAVLDLGNLVWLQAHQVNVRDGCLKDEDREYSE